jgi:hypothetical protein
MSLLGRESFGATRLLGWLAVLSFASLSLCVVAIVWPRADGNFDVDPRVLLVEHLSAGAPDAKVLSLDLIAHLGFHYRTNGRRLARMARSFRIGSCLLAIQLVLTVLAATATV